MCEIKTSLNTQSGVRGHVVFLTAHVAETPFHLGGLSQNVTSLLSADNNGKTLL